LIHFVNRIINIRRTILIKKTKSEYSMKTLNVRLKFLGPENLKQESMVKRTEPSKSCLKRVEQIMELTKMINHV